MKQALCAMAVRVLGIVLLAALPSALGACDEKSSDKGPGDGQEVRAADDDTASDVQEEVRARRNGGCQNIHYPGDERQPGDTCWDPPEFYCAEGQSTAIVKACAPDMSVCCMYGGNCIPCGWVSCSYCADFSADSSSEVPCGQGVERNNEDDGPECAQAPLSVPGDPMCPVIEWSAPICRDGVEAQLGCEETASDFALAVTGQLEVLTACTGDGDCILVTPELECPEVGVHLVECPMAVSAESSDAFEAGIVSLAETFCAAGVPPCMATPGCPPGEAKCIEGQCQFVLGEP